jgi:hypothetical protein
MTDLPGFFRNKTRLLPSFLSIRSLLRCLDNDEEPEAWLMTMGRLYFQSDSSVGTLDPGITAVQIPE